MPVTPPPRRSVGGRLRCVPQLDHGFDGNAERGVGVRVGRAVEGRGRLAPRGHPDPVGEHRAMGGDRVGPLDLATYGLEGQALLAAGPPGSTSPTTVLLNTPSPSPWMYMPMPV